MWHEDGYALAGVHKDEEKRIKGLVELNLSEKKEEV